MAHNIDRAKGKEHIMKELQKIRDAQGEKALTPGELFELHALEFERDMEEYYKKIKNR